MSACRFREAVAAAALTLLLCGCQHVTRTVYRDDVVKVTEHHTTYYPNVHGGSGSLMLTILGRDFKGVRGRNPYYLRVPGRPMILFVTGRDFDGGQAVVHLANTSTREIVNIPAYDSLIGKNIGEPKDDWFERVARVDGDLLVVEAGFLGRRYE